MKEAPLGGVLYAGNFRAHDSDWSKPPRHQACFLNPDLSIRWCKDLASKGTVFGLGTDASNNPIVISNSGSGSISAEWFGALHGRSLSGAFTILDILAPDGTQCGSFNVGLESGQCRTEDVTLAMDGTPIQLRPRDSFAGSCAYRWWPSALR